MWEFFDMETETFVQYQPQCSEIDFANFNLEDALKYDPEDETYQKDLVEKEGMPGIIVAGVCLLIAFALMLMSCCLCCCGHKWKTQSGLHRLSEKSCFGSILSFFLIGFVVLFTLGIVAMSAWGIQQTIAHVDDAVDDSFNFVEQTKIEVDTILAKTRAAIQVGNEIVLAMEQVNEDLDRDSVLNDPAVTTVVNLDETKTTLKEATVEADDALETANEEISENLISIQDALEDALTYEDDGETASKAITVLVIVFFAVFILVSVVMGCCSVFGTKAKLTYCWVVFMWLMLVVAFGLGVGILNVVREVSEDNCLFINDFGIRKVKQEVTVLDNQRIEQLLRFYFQAPGASTLNTTQIEELWDLPLTAVSDFLDDIDQELFDEDGTVKPIVRLTTLETQESLLNARRLFPAVRKSIADVQEIITGDTLQNIHKDLKDLLCCTQFDAVNAVFWAWVASSISGFILAVLVTWQVFSSLSFKTGENYAPYEHEQRGSGHPGQHSPAAQPVVAAPVAPPLQPSAYMNQSHPAVGTPVPRSYATVKYPTINQ